MIETPADLENAMQEFQRLREARDGTPEAARRTELNAEIMEYHTRESRALTKGRSADYVGPNGAGGPPTGQPGRQDYGDR